MRPLLSKAFPTALIHGPEITVSLNPAGTLAGKRFLPKRRPHATTAKPAMALSRLIPEIKPGRSCLWGSCTSQESAIDGGFSLGLYGNCGAKFAKMWGKSKIFIAQRTIRAVSRPAVTQTFPLVKRYADPHWSRRTGGRSAASVSSIPIV
jgi:hypothetical protein